MGPKRPPKGGSSSATAAANEAKRRRLERRTTEEKVRRSVVDHLPHVSEVQLTQHIVEGTSLLQRLTNDRRAARDEGKRLGPAYWQKIRQQYSLEDPTSRLIVKDDSEKVDPALVAALQQARSPNAAARSKSLLVNWCSSAVDVNQKMIVGLVKFIANLKPDKNAGAAQAIGGRGGWKDRGVRERERESKRTKKHREHKRCEKHGFESVGSLAAICCLTFSKAPQVLTFEHCVLCRYTFQNGLYTYSLVDMCFVILFALQGHPRVHEDDHEAEAPVQVQGGTLFLKKFWRP